MPVIVIANPKGGVGKSTLATNVAGALAHAGHAVMLGDVDRQQSSRQWLALRPAALPAIHGWEVAHNDIVRPPKGVSHVVLDTPAGLHGRKLGQVLKLVRRVIVPLQPSIFDILATQAFLDRLFEEKEIRKHEAFVAIVAMRVDARTRAAAELERFLEGTGLPVVAHLRDTQVYVQAAAHGMSIFDLPPSRAAQDVEQWQPLLDWVRRPV